MSIRRPVLLSVLFATSLTLVPCASVSAGSRVKVIVNPSVNGEGISRDQLASVFLGETTRWGNGQAIQAADQSTQSPTRAAFSNDVLARPVAAVQIHWVQKLSSGGVKPPLVKGSDQEVVEFVRATAGAIGYVSEAYPTEGVKVLSLSR
jgi:ABC-type phosphate transport system substrate-binding protein